MPGARVVDVARRHGIAANRLSTWRSLARTGKLAVPVDDSCVFAALELEQETPSGGVAAAVHAVEIAVDDLVIRLPGERTAAEIAALVSALRQRG